MAVISGFGGHIATDAGALGCVRQWGISHTGQSTPVVCSSSDGAQQLADGNLDWEGSFVGFGGLPPVMPGDAFEFHGAITGEDEDAVGANGDVMVSQVAIRWNQETGAPLEYTVTFQGDGPLSRDNSTLDVPPDTGVPNPVTSRLKKVEIAVPAGSPSFAELADVLSVTLTISRSNVDYNGTGNVGGYTRRALGNLAASLDIQLRAQDSDGWNSFPAIHAVRAVRLYTAITAIEGADAFWLLNWMKVTAHNGLDVDLAGPNIVGGTIQWGFHSATPISSTPTRGTILMPGGSAYWPAA